MVAVVVVGVAAVGVAGVGVVVVVVAGGVGWSSGRLVS